MVHNDRILQMLRSGDHAAVRAAVEEMRAEGTLSGGLLKKANLDGASLRAANFDLADFSWATLIGADMRGASLRGVILENATLAGTNLSGADFAEANLRHAILEDANLKEAEIGEYQLALADRLTGATMPDGSKYDGRFNLHADLDLARTDGVYPDKLDEIAEWYGVRVSQYEAGQAWAADQLEEAVGDALTALEADRVWIFEARHSGRLTNGGLAGADISNMSLAGACLEQANLSGATLDGAVLVRCKLTGADLSKASLNAANLTRADLSQCNLREADLGDALLVSANLENADLTDADPFGAQLDGADLTGAQIGVDQLVWADTLCGAIMPDGSLYDGRYNLEGDLDDARASGLDVDDAEHMAAFYDVEQSDYELGQKWAQAHLEKLLAQR